MIVCRRRIVSSVALATIGAPVGLGFAQEQKPARIVILSRSAYPEHELQAFREGLRDLGHVEGRTYVIELRDAGGDARDNDARLGQLAVEMARSKPDVIFAAQGQAAQAAKAATSTIPIVFSTPNPVNEGLVESFARPGGNATGVASPLNDKRLELLREAYPALKRVAFLFIPDSIGGLSQLEGFKAAADGMRIELLPIAVRTEAELGPAIEAAAQLRAEGLTHHSSPFFRSQARQIAALAAMYRLPTISDDSNTVESGGLMSYGIDWRARARRIAGYVDRILKGANPGDLPIEQPTHFELWINLRTARALGLTIPPALLARADRIIE